MIDIPLTRRVLGRTGYKPAARAVVYTTGPVVHSGKGVELAVDGPRGGTAFSLELTRDEARAIGNALLEAAS